MAIDMKKLVAVALFLSVAINIFVVGFWLSQKSGKADFRINRAAFMSAMGHLPPAVKEDFRLGLEADSSVLNKAGMDLRAARQEARAAMQAHPFDEKRLDAAFAQMRASSLELQTVIHQTAKRVIAQLPSEERAKLGQGRHWK
jgi:uncharacterized membrane protein